MPNVKQNQIYASKKTLLITIGPLRPRPSGGGPIKANALPFYRAKRLYPLALAVLLFRLFLVGPKMRTKIGQECLTKSVETYRLGAAFHAECNNDVSFLLQFNFDLDFGY